MKLKNVTKQVLRFECGDKEVSGGTVTVWEAGEQVQRELRKKVPMKYAVRPGETVDLADGYCIPRDGIIPRPSFLEENGLDGKLVPVPAEPDAPEIEVS